MTDANDYLVIGRVVSAYGLKGWVKVKSFTQPDTNFLKYVDCFIAPVSDSKKHWQPAEIEQGKQHGKVLAIKFVGYEDRTAADTLLKHEIAIKLDDLPDLADEDYYWHQLEGLEVWSVAESENEQFLGKVSHLLETGSNDVLVVKSCKGSIDKQERLLPYRPEVVLDIDLDASKMTVSWDPDF